MDHLKSLSSYFSMFLENAILFNEQKMQFQSVLEVLAASIDAKDPQTAGHSSRVAQYTVGIASELGFNEDDIDMLNVAASAPRLRKARDGRPNPEKRRAIDPGGV